MKNKSISQSKKILWVMIILIGILCINLISAFYEEGYYEQFDYTFGTYVNVLNETWFFAQTFTVGTTGTNENFDLVNISLNVSAQNAYLASPFMWIMLWEVNGSGAPDKSGGNLSVGQLYLEVPVGFRMISAEMTPYECQASGEYAIVYNFPVSHDTYYPRVQANYNTPYYSGGDYFISEDSGESFNPSDGTWDVPFAIYGSTNSPPNVTINSPENTTYTTSSILFNVTALDDVGMSSCWVTIDGGVSNLTLTNTTFVDYYFATNTTVYDGNYLAQFYCNDSDNKINDSKSIDFTVETTFTEISQTYNNETTEGNTETFNITIHYNSTVYPNIQGNLVYNETSYVGTKTDVEDNTVFSRDIEIPSVTADQNITFYWELILINNTNNYHNSTFNNQTVRNIVIDDCTTYTTLILNATLYDEETQEYLAAASNNSEIKIDVDIFSEGGTTPIIEYSQNYSLINSATVCLTDDLSNSTYQMDVQILYEGSSYASEYYNIQNYTLTNETTTTFPLNISLFDLLDANAQKFKLIVRDTSYLPISGALIQIERKYIEEGTFHIVEIPKTDEKGITSASLQLNDAIYNFHIYKVGVLIYSFTNVLAICQTPLVTECTIDFNAFQTKIGIPNYEEGDDFLFTLEYNDTSKVIKSEFIIPSGTEATIELEVIKEDVLGTTVCSDTLTSVSGTLSCTVPSSFGNSTVLAKIYKDGVEQGRGSIKLDQQPSDIFGVVLIMMSVLVMMTLIGIGISDSPVITGVFIIVGLILLFSMNLVKNTGFIGATATILFFIIAMILVIIKAAKRS